jgi:small conductance mechanosensitive channel
MLKLESIFGIPYSQIQEYILATGLKLVIAIAILIIGFWLAKIVSRMIKKLMTSNSMDAGLTSFLSSLASSLLKVLVFITAITQMGIEMTSFVALLGAAGLAIGMAFSGTLSNFAGGVMILVFKPFKVGDMILAQGEQGVVKEILIFNTYMNTPDNKVVILPNGSLANGVITNFTKQETRRVDFVFGIAYGDDLKKAKEVLTSFINDDERILKDPAPFVGVATLGDSSVNIAVKVWSKVEDYWPIFFAMNERVYEEFGDHGLNIPFPQMDLHIQK